VATEHTWRQWKTSNHELGTPPDLNLTSWQQEAGRRKIPRREGSDILRWGHSASSNFSVKEAYGIQCNHNNQQGDNIWSKIWRKELWPKVSTFLWLIIHNRILTWDNLRKRGFTGPSMCVLCQSQEETKEHLFNGCSYSQIIWDQGAQIMRRSNQNHGSIRDTIENWDSIIYSNPILNHIWLLLPGFILWQIWKERNKCIFHSKHSPTEATWSSVVKLIRETIQSKNWLPRDKECNREEAHIFQGWKLNLKDSAIFRPPKSHFPSPSLWDPPSIWIHKNQLRWSFKRQPWTDWLWSGHQELHWGNPNSECGIFGRDHQQCCGTHRPPTGTPTSYFPNQSPNHSGRGFPNSHPTHHKNPTRGTPTQNLSQSGALQDC
jgi:hypothetical protein